MPPTTTVSSQRWLIGMMAVAGLILALGFPNGLLPGALGDRPYPVIAWLALLPFFWGMLALPPRPARLGVWLFGLSFSLVHVTWVHLFGVNLLGVLLWFLLAGYLSLYPLLAYRLAQCMPGGRSGMFVGFALSLTGLEWLRGLGVFGFPWAEIGMSQVDGSLAAIAAIGGIQLISFLMLLTAGAITLRLQDISGRRLMIIAIAALLACFLAGWAQTYRAVSRMSTYGSAHYLNITVVQPSTSRGLMASDLTLVRTPEEWVREQNRRLDALLPLSQAPGAAQPGVTHLVIWPESALPFPPSQYFDGARQLCAQTHSYLLVGAPGFTFDGKEMRQRNSAYLVSPQGDVGSEYAKVHLVPFGEFVPFVRPLITHLFSIRDDDLVPGTEHRLLQVDGHPLGVGICFESTFAGIARDYANNGAHLLVYITNDAWFHQTPAVRQHFNQARFRAIETGLPVARCASTGISGFITPDGRVREEIPTYARGASTQLVFDGLPGTVYTSGGWLFAPLCLLVALLLAIIGIVQTRRRSREANRISA